MSSTRKAPYALVLLVALLFLGAVEAKADPLTVILHDPNQTTPFDTAFFYVTMVNNSAGQVGINYVISAPGAQTVLLSQFAPSSLNPGESFGLTFGPRHLFTVLTPFFGPVGVTYSGTLTVNYRESLTGDRYSVVLPFTITKVQAPEPQPTPEPATVLLLATGLAGVGARAARRRRRLRG
ncbi:MAG: PEP-CTERM sorting domain-containing protein [Pyrinomonadaceae bacterium]